MLPDTVHHERVQAAGARVFAYVPGIVRASPSRSDLPAIRQRDRVPGPTLRSSLLVSQPLESVFPVGADNGILEIALRTRVPPGYAAWHMPQFTRVTMGSPSAIEFERQAIESQRLSALAPSILINLLLCVAGATGLALYKIQRTAREYVSLGSYLLIVGISNVLSTLQSCGLLPLSANLLIADPLICVWVIAQIKFTYSFAGRRVGRIWRIPQPIIALLRPTFSVGFRACLLMFVPFIVLSPQGWRCPEPYGDQGECRR